MKRLKEKTKKNNSENDKRAPAATEHTLANPERFNLQDEAVPLPPAPNILTHIHRHPTFSFTKPNRIQHHPTSKPFWLWVLFPQQRRLLLCRNRRISSAHEQHAKDQAAHPSPASQSKSGLAIKTLRALVQ
ncbi:hypothetical protein D6783_05910 [Candidatus Woesearchaeota archaeon]|nr:MAG: hypothetical protein D6783_05910 [Candidatus Woesearchaeota archaeon]